MSTNKKSTASQALLDMDNILAAIKEESKKSLGTMLNEAVRDVIREECNEDDDDEYSVLDNDNDINNDAVDNEGNDSEDTVNAGTDGNDSTEDGAQQDSVDTDAQDANAEGTDDTTDNVETEPTDGAEAPEDNTDGDSEGSFDEFADFETSDGVYDLSGEKDSEKAVRAFKLLNNDDILLVKKGDGTLKLKDNEAGTEYLIDLGTDDDTEGDNEGQPQATSLNESEDDIAGLPSDDLGSDSLDPTPDANLDNSFDGGFAPDGEEPMGGMQPTNDVYSKIDSIQQQIDSLKARKQVAENKNKKARKPMKESKEVLFEVDLGYTDNYQDKDPIKGLSNNEPSKSGRSWHKGVPTGTEKPWAGDSKSKGAPFSKTEKVEGSVNEEFDNVDLGTDDTMDEATTVGGAVQHGSEGSKSHIPSGRKNYGRFPKHHVSTSDDGYVGNVNEIAAIKKENKELKEAIQTLKKNLTEAYITNVNLGKITKLFLENATSQQEKIDIVNRFSNEAKTVEQSKALFESINKELKKKGTSSPTINETSMTVNGTKTLNESAPYKSNDFLKTIDLMNRMKNC